MYFSILANEFKSDDIKTVEELKNKILNAPIEPAPVCVDLDYIFSWKEFIGPNLADPPLKNHSMYHSFIVAKEEGVVKFRAKRYPQDKEYVPRAGLRLVKEGVQFIPVGAADFRVESIPFDKINRTISVMTSMLPLGEKILIQNSYDRLRDKLEAAPKRKHLFEKLDLASLPKIDYSVRNGPPISICDDGLVEEITGDLLEESISEGSLEEIREDIDVCVYSEETAGRPWVGRVRQMLPGGKFVIHWFNRKSGRGQFFKAMALPDGSPYLSEIDLETIMFWAFTEDSRDDGFKISTFWQDVIQKEYEKLDS